MRDDIKQIYDKALENDSEQAPESLRRAYQNMHDAFEDYLCEIGAHAFEFGYKTAKKILKAEQGGD